MRLIDADSLLVNMDKGIQGTAREYLKFYQMAVNDEPTAYDLDKVVNGLNEMIEDNVDMDTGERCENWVVDMCNDLVLKCGEIVKSGLKV